MPFGATLEAAAGAKRLPAAETRNRWCASLLKQFGAEGVAMGKVISIEERRLLRSLQGELKDSVLEALEGSMKVSGDNCAVLPYGNLDDWLKQNISGELIKRRQTSEEVVLCGMYTAAMLARVDCDLRKYAVDFLEQWSASADPAFLKMGGDFCFVVCSGFHAAARRMMKLADYQKLGVTFYDWFYSSTGKVIGRYMSANFELMQDIVRPILALGPRPGTLLGLRY